MHESIISPQAIAAASAATITPIGPQTIIIDLDDLPPPAASPKDGKDETKPLIKGKDKDKPQPR